MSKLSFKTFCIEYYAEHTKQSSEKVYEIFKDTKLLDLLDSDYGDLHGNGEMEYLMQFFDEYLGEGKDMILYHGTTLEIKEPKIFRK